MSKHGVLRLHTTYRNAVVKAANSRSTLPSLLFSSTSRVFQTQYLPRLAFSNGLPVPQHHVTSRALKRHQHSASSASPTINITHEAQETDTATLLPPYTPPK